MHGEVLQQISSLFRAIAELKCTDQNVLLQSNVT